MPIFYVLIHRLLEDFSWKHLQTPADVKASGTWLRLIHSCVYQLTARTAEGVIHVKNIYDLAY